MVNSVIFKPRVFISYSEKGEDTDSPYLATLIRFIEKKGFVVLQDRKISPIKQWRPEIDKYIFSCDLAIIILSQAACQSDYVKYEATLLRSRWQAYQSEFKLIIVSLPDVIEQVVEEKMAPLQLTEHQWIKIQSFKKIRCQLRQLSGCIDEAISRAPRHKLEKLVGGSLHLKETSAEALDEIGSNLLPDHKGQLSNKDKALLIARGLFDFDGQYERNFPILKEVCERTQRYISEETARQIAYDVAPFCWVEPEIARQILRIASQLYDHHQDVTYRGLAWCRSWNKSEIMHLSRVFCGKDEEEYHLIEISGGSRAGVSREDLNMHIQKCISERFYGDSDDSIDWVQKRLIEVKKEGIPVFLLLYGEGIEKEQIGNIQQDWKEVSLFIYWNKKGDDTVNWEFPNTCYIDSSNDEDRERFAKGQWQTLTRLTGIQR